MNIAKTVFGVEDMKENYQKKFSLMPFTLFCENGRGDGFEGDEIEGFPMKFCNQFFQTPSDVGFCMTKNVEINNLIQTENLNQYSNFIEVKKQDSELSGFIGTYSAESTGILLTNVFSDDLSTSYRYVSDTWYLMLNCFLKPKSFSEANDTEDKTFKLGCPNANQ